MNAHLSQVEAPSVHFVAPAPRNLLQRKCACGGTPSPTGECAECRKKRLGLQRRTAGKAAPSTVPPIVAEVLRSPGRPLDTTTRAFMEPRFGHDFRRVRVHADVRAAESAAAVTALAYTVGSDIVFGAAQYVPHTIPGKRLLAHELTHVVQQRGDDPHPMALSIGEPDDAAEREAETFAKAHSTAVVADRRTWAGSAATRARVLPGTVQRLLDPVVTPTQERAARELARRSLPQTVRRAGWRQFWRAVVRRFALRGAVAAGLAAVDGPLPVGDLIALGLTIWTIWEIIQLWDVLWREAEVEPVPEQQPQPEEQPETETHPPATRDRRQDCRRANPTFLSCEDPRTMEEVATSFANSRGIDVTSLDCQGISSAGAGSIDECLGAPGESWHCRVNGSDFVVSLFGCFCCRADGTVGKEWRGPHQSAGPGSRPEVRRQDTRRERRERSDRDRQRRERRERSEDEE